MEGEVSLRQQIFQLVLIISKRYCLNFKGVAYKTEWIEYPDIESHCVKLGIPPTSTKPDGRAHYTLPALHDPSTGVYISDSLLIAEYLDKTYPSAPSLFPNHTIGVQWPFSDAFTENISALWTFILPPSGLRLNPPSEAYFRRTREASYGKTLEDIVPKGDAAVEQWGKFKEGLDKVDAWYAKSGGPYLLGDTVSWADFSVAGYIVWMRIVWGEDSQEWKDISSWHGGRWKELLNNLKKYEIVV
jgi:glutathione S-transferase